MSVGTWSMPISRYLFPDKSVLLQRQINIGFHARGCLDSGLTMLEAGAVIQKVARGDKTQGFI